MLTVVLKNLQKSENNYCKITFDTENNVILAEGNKCPPEYPSSDSVFYNSNGFTVRAMHRAFELTIGHYELNEIYMVEVFFDGEKGVIAVGGYKVNKENFMIVPI